ncbi:DUF393 domain-containing protein [bacterium]|nr:DUF393 domain-containing protein [bacterium]
MRKLTVVYDATCGFCVRCASWLTRQPAFLEVECIWVGAPEVEERFPGLIGPGKAELVAVSDEGGVYRGAHAWIMCLYALRDYREWALRLARPGFFGFARRAFEIVSENRSLIARLLGLDVARELEKALTEDERSLVLSASREGASRCGYCHDEAHEDATVCPSCRAVLHEECGKELGRCPTIGCAKA